MMERYRLWNPEVTNGNGHGNGHAQSGKPHAGGAKRVKRAAPAPEAVKPDPAASGVSGAVLEMIRKGPPRTSGQIIEVLQKIDRHVTPAAVYSATNYWKNAGKIEGRVDEEDGGLRKWHPV